MRVPYKWLKDYVEINETPQKIAEILTGLGLEVEEIEDRGKEYDGLVVGEVVELTKMPRSKHLSLVKVSTGKAEHQVVCGAPNVAMGQKVVYASVGTTLPNGLYLDEIEIRGVISKGMLCSRDELGWQEERDEGIIVLPADAPVGLPLVVYLEMDDNIFVLDLTPNFGHAAGMIGVARELAAATENRVDYPLILTGEESGEAADIVAVDIVEPDLCPRYTLRVLEGVTVGPSPNWMQQRLLAAGLRPINNIVDITNYVMLEYSQPLHAFDLDKIAANKIVVRPAAPGESIVTLDGKLRELAESDLVIADAEKPVCIAGVMGGENSEVTAETKNILLEGACFNPGSVRVTAKKFNLPSESSYRFERGVDIERVAEASLRAARLMEKLAGGELIGGIVDEYPQPFEPKQVNLRPQRVNQLLGTDIAPIEIKNLLERLHFTVKESKGHKDTFEVRIPSFRNDVEMEADLIEEVGRLYGYNNIPVSMPRVDMVGGEKGAHRELQADISLHLAQLGFSQVMTLPLMAEDESSLADDSKPFLLKNPLNEDLKALRESLIPGLLRTLQFNVKRQNHKVNIFEIGRVFRDTGIAGKVGEVVLLASLVTGAEALEPWTRKAPSFFALKGALENLLDALNLAYEFRQNDCSFLHPGRQAKIVIAGVDAGFIGELHPLYQERYGLHNPVALSELFVSQLGDAMGGLALYKSVPRFPAVTRDLAFVVDGTVPAKNLADLIKESAGSDLESLKLFDLYQGAPIPTDKKSLAYALVFRNQHKTLTDEEVDKNVDRIIAKAAAVFKATLRK